MDPTLCFTETEQQTLTDPAITLIQLHQETHSRSIEDLLDVSHLTDLPDFMKSTTVTIHTDLWWSSRISEWVSALLHSYALCVTLMLKRVMVSPSDSLQIRSSETIIRRTVNKCYLMFYKLWWELQQLVDSCNRVRVTSYINGTFIIHLYCVDWYFSSWFNSLLTTQTLISAHVLLMCYFVMTLLEAHYH